MNAPRWFWYVVAGCLIVLTATVGVSRLRSVDTWQLRDEHAFNPRTGVVCWVEQGRSWCRNLVTGKVVKNNPPRSLESRVDSIARARRP